MLAIRVASYTTGMSAIHPISDLPFRVKRLRSVALPIPRVIVCAEDVARGKPFPDCYINGAVQLGCAPIDCVIFEDSFPGMEAGRAAGATVVAVATTHARREVMREGHLAINDLRGVTFLEKDGELELCLDCMN